ncbi:Na(+)-translocating NADH-quinone reductase subunit C [Pseudoalteromonas sp. SR43-6]|jgi:Na+-transporting NADH:ubiquinone oxidoreductase subunit C|uniref:Na(+)-translocating NADH-quinone reductase subunit C n=3 Tax=Pseudomonadota TaxID=1224 RepID=F3BGW7_9GAMM|nr:MULTISPECIES: Na(+)-translocating NADH-quinone reductase subunit C [Pseudoalteromonas]EGI74110.1 Na(+)-translocating NADH-quinone reductase, subunit C [Pseudoalteromonas distincta]KAA1151197.1 Na(+)-translocating NADH-quinone reductase subunit C [Pseudoalteromonas sp. FUC4]KAA1159201.1 Na(+)-translocating NADH-quinone reductase subunit C [Pseudoalteromonas distincta]KHM44533.1 Na(+)-translocating NADH-quinone reductase subunit C [Pseudoalteromonas elyakovii]KID40074.1 Na(+)-translocating NA|tara:strand:+ start:2894 stop:3646 length:753 start_codon:yes stop_codon:yes gene_type:complete
MSSNNESIGKTLSVVVALCLVCAIIVSFASVQLRPLQQANKNKDIQSNILAAAGIDKVENVLETFDAKIEARVVNMTTGEFVDTDPTIFDFEKSKYDAALSVSLQEKGVKDIAGIQRVTKESPVYISKKEDGSVDAIILPIQGYGLWGLMYGFISLESDGETVKGIIFYKHNETPGLGGEIQNPQWTATWEGKELPIQIVKGTAGNDEHKIDGLSGATLTSNGVDHAVDFWTGENGFGPFLAKVRKGALK